MATKVIMPQLGESVVEGTVTKWLKQEGDKIEEFEPLLEVNTDKVDTEVPAPANGTLLRIYVEEGETVEAGRLLAVVGEEGEKLPEPPDDGVAQPTAEAQARRPANAAEATKAESAAKAGRSGVLGFISPVVARISSEHDVDLKQVQGTGRGGRITKQDVLTFIESGAAEKGAAEVVRSPWEEPGTGELFRPSEEVFGKAAKPAAKAKAGGVLPLDPVRKAIADHMVRSKHTSPHVTTVMEADLSAIVVHRSRHKEAFQAEGIALTFSAYFATATVAALKGVPLANSSFTEEGIQLHKRVNLGIAVSLGERGLIVPVIKAADEMSLRGLARAINELATRARDRKLTPQDVQGGTFTITNHGVSGSLFATPIISQPQAAILGVGAIQKRPVVVENTDARGLKSDVLAIRPMVYLTLTFDHRIIDGAVADQFLAGVVSRLEHWD